MKQQKICTRNGGWKLIQAMNRSKKCLISVFSKDFLLLCMSVLPAWMYVYYTGEVPVEPSIGCQISRIAFASGCEKK